MRIGTAVQGNNNGHLQGMQPESQCPCGIQAMRRADRRLTGTAGMQNTGITKISENGLEQRSKENRLSFRSLSFAIQSHVNRNDDFA